MGKLKKTREGGTITDILNKFAEITSESVTEAQKGLREWQNTDNQRFVAPGPWSEWMLNRRNCQGFEVRC